MVKVKVCGITNLDDALAAIEHGADALGFVFAPSPRQVTVQVVKDIISRLPPFVCKVGVFVNSEFSEVQEIMSACNLDMAQLHGDEDRDYCAALFPKVIKVFTPDNMPPGRELKRYKIAAFMLDKDKRTTAGNAILEELWQLARNVADYGPVILAGGLTPENVGHAIEIARPYAVDVSSGVEAKPGQKDHKKIRAFIAAATVGTDHCICTDKGQSHRIAPTNNADLPVGADHHICPHTGQSHGIAPTNNADLPVGADHRVCNNTGQSHGIAPTNNADLPVGADHRVCPHTGQSHGIAPTNNADLPVGADHCICTDTGQSHGIAPTNNADSPVGADHCICTDKGQSRGMETG